MASPRPRTLSFSVPPVIAAPTPQHPDPSARHITQLPKSTGKNAVPVEQAEGYARSRDRVAEAALNVLGLGAHELLAVSVDVLRFAPIFGLQEAAKTLLDIWDALKLVNINRLACLRLTERCATVLIAIREDIAEAGDDVAIELQSPLARLVESYKEVHRFLERQSQRSFLKRYLQREEIQRAFVGCHNSLTDVLGMFNTSVQIRTLKQVVAAGQQRQQDMQAILDSIQERALEPPAGSLLLTTEPTLNHDQVLTQLQTVTAKQDELDAAFDAEDLRQQMRSALQANSDVEMIRTLEVSRDQMPEAIKALQRALEQKADDTAVDPENPQMLNPPPMVRDGSNASSDSARSRRSSHTLRDTLDQEFMETGIDAMRRLSGVEVPLPSWTITDYEVVRGEKIGMGAFSDVYEGKWRNQVVAIKNLKLATPQALFVREVSIWKTLQHPNVLGLFGACSASSDPPWFFVSPYLRNGSLVTYLRSRQSLGTVDLLRMVHEIVKGMAYLHSKDILHGDLKAVNVLVSDEHHCVISDFGQSEIRSEAYRMSGLHFSHGTLRWQAPEVMSGTSGLTKAVDVYAFAITCVELLTKGALPWPMADDDAVRHFVVHENTRPEPPSEYRWSQQFISNILRACWNQCPDLRPSFKVVEERVRELRAQYGGNLEAGSEELPQPIPPPLLSSNTAEVDTAQVLTRCSSLASEFEFRRPVSPPPRDEHARMVRDERRYRMLLQHKFDSALTLPLWSPSKVDVGAVGYHNKRGGGKFVTLFNAFEPGSSSDVRTKGIPSLTCFGDRGSHWQKGQPSVTQRGGAIISIVSSWLGARNKYGERYSMQLCAGRKAAHLFTQSTTHRYIGSKNIPLVKQWFKDNINTILAIYGDEHRLSREDVYLVIGTLDAKEYALFVSHEHSSTEVLFDAYSAPKVGQPWGELTFKATGSMYQEPEVEPQYTKKVSNFEEDGCWDCVLLARLRFKPDEAEPMHL
ncbi:kinase-like protein [Lentinus tigrinus ALCF2SS1-7]|uniref:Kinase-like protein n=1 Tax=Lentinus tigrinus ALCF2SS1-6 TaxID=1328759 RepID=A0A5C2RML1_9APHY|nr:kinase-like protein [Lentinus tigrinus ALCF2SS1-6]RPD52868.1 kinase-like protein [Lentinus tigrinus ALCF2SS1-6]RPD67782.1 kinase-like protein [Lentinus tigrinus ALCF2SS1-7]